VSRRATFGPVVLLGLASAALAAVAGNKPWTDVQEPGGECGLYVPPGVQWSDLARGEPLAGALGLVVLAAWGVLLVTRGRVRRSMALVATLAAVGFLATAVAAYGTLKDDVLDKAAERVGKMPYDCHPASVWMDNTWWPTALVVGVLAIIAGLLAVWLAPTWPEMGSKYDAPSAGAQPAAVPLEQQSSVDLWKALDAGHDPTLDSGTDPENHDGPSA
jgi:uncharacterized membrane protein (TIGR02234 family)